MSATYTIKIPQVKLFGYHGCYDKEKKEGQQFEINVKVVFLKNNLTMNDKIDSIDNTYDYVEIVKCVREVFDNHRYNLLEELAHDIGTVIYSNNPIKACPVERVVVNIKKYKPEGMDVPYVEVEFKLSSNE